MSARVPGDGAKPGIKLQERIDTADLSPAVREVVYNSIAEDMKDIAAWCYETDPKTVYERLDDESREIAHLLTSCIMVWAGITLQKFESGDLSPSPFDEELVKASVFYAQQWAENLNDLIHKDLYPEESVH